MRGYEDDAAVSTELTVALARGLRSPECYKRNAIFDSRNTSVARGRLYPGRHTSQEDGAMTAIDPICH
jgi:hypothetical protein